MAGRPNCRKTWLAHGNPWEFERRESSYEVGFGGVVEMVDDDGEEDRHVWKPQERVIAVAYDTPVVGWKANASTRCGSGKRSRSTRSAGCVQLPVTTSAPCANPMLQRQSPVFSIRRTATKQVRNCGCGRSFFFSSASLQDILRRHAQQYRITQTSPTRWRFSSMTRTGGRSCGTDAAFDRRARHILGEGVGVTKATFGYTTTRCSLRRWKLGPWNCSSGCCRANADRLPHQRRCFLEARKERGFSDSDVAAISLIDESHGRRVRMGLLAFVGSHSINGVSALHTELMKETVFADLHRLYPDRINNKTNGVTPRRWLNGCNPGTFRPDPRSNRRRLP